MADKYLIKKHNLLLSLPSKLNGRSQITIVLDNNDRQKLLFGRS